MALPANFAWVNAANVAIPMTADTFKALTAAIFTWTQDCFSVYQGAKMAILDWTTPQTLMLPTWPTA
jgi:hypothetical protein